MRKLITTICTMAFATAALAQPIEVKLYPEGEPSSNGLNYVEFALTGKGTEAIDPTMFVYPAKESSGVTVLICPGGGYSRTAIDHEGHQFARWFNENGVNAVVLRYRMPNKHTEIPYSDVMRALDIMHERADEWGFDTKQIGVMGFSAGGHLASTAATHFPSEKYRPAFSILIYPVISMDDALTHKGSKKSLLGDNPTEELVAAYSNNKRVTANTPPTFLALSDNDKVVDPRNSVQYYTALKDHGVPAEMHIYDTGGHGFGFRTTFIYHDEFIGSIIRWVKGQANIK